MSSKRKAILHLLNYRNIRTPVPLSCPVPLLKFFVHFKNCRVPLINFNLKQINKLKKTVVLILNLKKKNGSFFLFPSYF